MLLADGWSEVDSLDFGEKKEVIFPSLVRFISKYAYYGQATIRATQERKISFIEQRALLCYVIFKYG